MSADTLTDAVSDLLLERGVDAVEAAIALAATLGAVMQQLDPELRVAWQRAIIALLSEDGLPDLRH